MTECLNAEDAKVCAEDAEQTRPAWPPPPLAGTSAPFALKQHGPKNFKSLLLDLLGLACFAHGSSTKLKKPINISLKVCSPNPTVTVGSGLSGFKSELSHAPEHSMREPAGIILG